jgi:hypothetical protein
MSGPGRNPARPLLFDLYGQSMVRRLFGGK